MARIFLIWKGVTDVGRYRSRSVLSDALIDQGIDAPLLLGRHKLLLMTTPVRPT